MKIEITNDDGTVIYSGEAKSIKDFLAFIFDREHDTQELTFADLYGTEEYFKILSGNGIL